MPDIQQCKNLFYVIYLLLILYLRKRTAYLLNFIKISSAKGNNF